MQKSPVPCAASAGRSPADGRAPDALLRPFLQAGDDLQRGSVLERLLRDHVEPILSAALRSHGPACGFDAQGVQAGHRCRGPAAGPSRRCRRLGPIPPGAASGLAGDRPASAGAAGCAAAQSPGCVGAGALPLLWMCGVAGLGEVASALGLASGELIALCDQLPLDDGAMAARLGITRREVVSLRLTARRRLARRTGIGL